MVGDGRRLVVVRTCLVCLGRPVGGGKMEQAQQRNRVRQGDERGLAAHGLVVEGVVGGRTWLLVINERQGWVNV